jgi:hypothetical protein
MKKAIFTLLIYGLLLTGWIKSIYKAVNCNWSPIGKAEILYTIGSLTGAGVIIGWFDIKDE